MLLQKTKKLLKPSASLLSGLFLLTLFLGLLTPAIAQVPENENKKENIATTETPAPKSSPIPLSNIIIQADADASRLQIFRSDANKTSPLSKITQDLPAFSNRIDALIVETKRISQVRPSLETLRKLEEDWQVHAKKTTNWKAEIKGESDGYNKTLDELKNLKSTWELTLAELTKIKTSSASENSAEDTSAESQSTPETDSDPVEIPTAVIEKARAIIEDVNKTQKIIEQKQASLLTLQTKISAQAEKVDSQVQLVKDAHQDALSNLFIQDQLPIWRAGEAVDSSDAVLTETQISFAVQTNAFREYASTYRDRFLLHGIVFLLFLFGMLWIRRHVGKWLEDEPKIERATRVFGLPLMTALLFSLLLGDLFYPQSPRMLSSLLQALALIPAILILRRLIPKSIFPLLYTLPCFYLLGRLLELFVSLQFVTRVVFLFEMLAAFLFSIWFLYSINNSKEKGLDRLGIIKVIKVVMPLAMIGFAVSFVANIFGYGALSRVIGNGILDSAIIALIFYVGFKIAESFVILTTHVRPLSLLGMVKSHRNIIQNNILRVLGWFAIIAWIIVTLNILSLRDYVFSFVSAILFKQFETSVFSISLGDILAFGLTVWLAFLLSRIARFVLEKDIYPRVNFSGGASYAFSTVLHYVVLLVGFVLAIAALGVDLSKFTILAGAFGVGLGFGLQNIVNNFVSGLFLLFERPVKVGDFVEVDNELGELTQIGLRASTIRTRDGSDLILPNGYLISEKMTNWTHVDKRRRLEINIGVSYNSDPREVLELLKEVAMKTPNVLSDPEPNAVLIEFGDNSLNFRLRAWTNIADRWRLVYSSIAVNVFEALKKAEIEIPYPQLDLHLDNKDKESLLGKEIEK